MDYQLFYRRLFTPLEELLGPIDPETIFAIIGFDCGGPLNFSTIRAPKGSKFITYVSCELAVRSEQQPSKFGRYELLTSCDDEQWVRSVITDIGRMSMSTVFDHGHTLDIGPCIDQGAPIQGIIFEKVIATEIDGESYGVLRCIGITRPEMEFAQEQGSKSLFAKLKQAGVYPNTEVLRKSVL